MRINTIGTSSKLPLKQTKKTLKEGDWVWLGKEICRIEKILQFYFEKGDEEGKAGEKSYKEASLKPFLTSKFTKYIRKPFECRLNALVPLTPQQERKLNTVIKKNPLWLKQLNASEPAPFRVMNHEYILIRSKRDLKKFDMFITFVKRGKTSAECEKELRKQGLLKLIVSGRGSHNAYLTFFSDCKYNHRKKGIIWNDAELYNRPEF